MDEMKNLDVQTIVSEADGKKAAALLRHVIESGSPQMELTYDYTNFEREPIKPDELSKYVHDLIAFYLDTCNPNVRLEHDRFNYSHDVRVLRDAISRTIFCCSDGTPKTQVLEDFRTRTHIATTVLEGVDVNPSGFEASDVTEKSVNDAILTHLKYLVSNAGSDNDFQATTYDQLLTAFYNASDVVRALYHFGSYHSILEDSIKEVFPCCA